LFLLAIWSTAGRSVPAGASGSRGRAFAIRSYALDPAHSTIGFTVRHLVINDIPGRFRDFAGSVQCNSEKMSENRR
jgi:polyisoprenoid-binding protein YceI